MTSLVVQWSESLTTNHEVPVSVPGSTVGNFPEGKDSRGDHVLGRLVEIRFKGPSGHYILLYHHSHHRDNVTAPHGRPKLRSRLHFCHAQEGGPRSPQGYVVALKKKHQTYLDKAGSVQSHGIFLPSHHLEHTDAYSPHRVHIEMEEFSDFRFKELAVIELLTAEKVPTIEIHRRMQAVCGDQCVDVSRVRRWVR